MTEPAPSTAPPRWARIFTIVASVIAAGALVFTLRQVGVGTVVDQLRAIGAWFVALVAIEVVSALCDALAISGFLGAAAPRSSFARVLHAQVAGRAINLVTPLASLGEATKVTLLMRDTETTRAVAAIARFTMVYVAINLGFIVLGAPVCALALPLPGWLTRTLWVGTALAVVIGGGLALLLRAGMVTTVVHGLARARLISAARAERWRAKATALDGALRGDGRGLRGWAPGLWALVSKVLQWFAAWLVLYANGHAPPLDVMAALATAGTLVNIVANIVPLGLGVTEGGTAALMVALGQPASLGVTTAVARRVVMVLYSAFGLALLVQAEVRPWRRRAPP
ncbi:MAG: flippase-like domain-containing protein [Myxococcales bacterium]|nr:flippase-like domain-containing protein [Myxococcales bacterium]